MEEQKEEQTKKRRILDRDFDTVETFIKNELESREKNPFRKKHESKWKEVDRQIAMDPMKKVSPDGREIKGDWQSALELGELSKASEIITADVMRIIFANDNWLEAHVDLEGMMNPQSGKYEVPEGEQEKQDGLVRALFTQQHKDFGLKARVRLSIKEALHHGSFVAEARWDQQMMIQGAKLKTIGAPVWQPYSMWNSYPDPSPSVLGTNLFYTGSMILVEYMPLWKLKRMKGEGWLPNRVKLVKKEDHKDKDNETQDVKLVKYFGDVSIERQDGDIYLPNMKIVLANGKLVFAKANDLPYPPVIYAGYERQEIRDPYYTSPIIKQSPTQKFTTVMANEFMDAIRLRTKPPVEYDANDPDYVANGGPDLSPSSKNPTKSMGKGFKALEIGDPNAALTGMQFGIRQLQEGLGVSSLRQGSDTSDRQTATEAKIMEQGSEVRTIDFIGELEAQGLRPFLYMQHALNKLNLGEYVAYSNELNTPDIVRFTKSDIDKDIHFDVVGAKGILGEQQRQQQVSNVTVFAAGSPLFAPLLKSNRILIDMYKDAGKKNPEEWVKTQEEVPQIPPELQMQIQQMQQVMAEMQQELMNEKQGNAVKMAELKVKAQMAQREFQADLMRMKKEQNAEARQAMLNAAFERWKARLEASTTIQVARIQAAAKPKAA
jgi:hypothetical protein